MIYINIHSLESAAEKRQLVRYFFINIFTARKRNLRRLCFYTCLSVHRGEVPGQVPPGRYTPLGRYSPPSGQVHPSPPLDRSPPGQIPLPGRYTPQAGTPPGQQCMLGDMGNKLAVRILLECILVGGMFIVS